MRRVTVVYSLILDETKQKVLMVRNRDRDSWSLPGGAVEDGESLEQAAVREAKEETGLDVRVFGITAVNEAMLEIYEEHVIFITFRAAIVGGSEEIVRPDEISDIQWIDLTEADRLYPYYKEGFREIVRNNREVSYHNEGRVKS
ncbi:NUDIX hydrolase [Paenibacillus kobensis]|uniref:NUDIX hydrolase n=1 Tax=Paenibacillus kobensis TaxID=59841 RepID=UPI000FD7C8C2|nr:NUDIX hydrolase [Paenibacillus kobensis]